MELSTFTAVMSSLAYFATGQYNGAGTYRYFKMRQNLRDGRKHNHIVELFPEYNPLGHTQVMLIGDLGKVSNNWSVWCLFPDRRYSWIWFW